jgi:hypothetical protein
METKGAVVPKGGEREQGRKGEREIAKERVRLRRRCLMYIYDAQRAKNNHCTVILRESLLRQVSSLPATDPFHKLE